jgi:hypothetical protein
MGEALALGVGQIERAYYGAHKEFERLAVTLAENVLSKLDILELLKRIIEVRINPLGVSQGSQEDSPELEVGDEGDHLVPESVVLHEIAASVSHYLNRRPDGNELVLEAHGFEQFISLDVIGVEILSADVDA